MGEHRDKMRDWRAVEATLTQNLAVRAQIHRGAVGRQAAAGVRGGTEKRLVQGPNPQAPRTPPCPPGLPFGTLDVGWVLQEPGKVLVELLHRRPDGAKREAHAVLQAGQGACRDSGHSAGALLGRATAPCPPAWAGNDGSLCVLESALPCSLTGKLLGPAVSCGSEALGREAALQGPPSPPQALLPLGPGHVPPRLTPAPSVPRERGHCSGGTGASSGASTHLGPVTQPVL